jgi:hypothetical protein
LLFREIADSMVSSGLRELGYQYINIDDSWASHRDARGNLVADLTKFPSGMKALADYIHSKGLKFGIYSSRGDTTCVGQPGSRGFEKQDAALFASWDVDYLKYDSCGSFANIPVWDQNAIMRDALNMTGRPIYYSICAIFPWESLAKECYPNLLFSPIPFLTHKEVTYQPYYLANAWLVEYCNMADTFGKTEGGYGMLSNLDAQQDLTWANISGHGGWNDMDMTTVS